MEGSQNSILKQNNKIMFDEFDPPQGCTKTFQNFPDTNLRNKSP